MRRRLRGNDGHPAPALGEAAQDVVLDAVVVGDDVEARRARGAIAFAERPRARRPLVGRGAAHDLRQVESRHRWRRPRPRDGGVDIDLAPRRPRDDAAVLRAALAQHSREATRVDVGDRDDAVVDEIGAQVAVRAEVRSEARQVADHESRGKGLPRLDVLRVHADVADVRIRERDDLAGVGGIGEDLLVAGHRRVEHDFADGVARGADRATAERRCRRRAPALPGLSPEAATDGRGQRRSNRAWRNRAWPRRRAPA